MIYQLASVFGECRACGEYFAGAIEFERRTWRGQIHECLQRYGMTIAHIFKALIQIIDLQLLDFF